MDKVGIFLSTTTLQSLSPAVRQELIRCVFDSLDARPNSTPPAGIPTVTVNTGNHAEISKELMDMFLSGCSDKTKALLTLLAKGQRTFNNTALAHAYGVDGPSKLAGVWSGITRRTRKLLNNPNAEFASWAWNEEGQHWVGSLTETTHQSLRKVLG